MTRGGAGEQGANRVNRLAVASDDAANVALPQLHAKNRRFPRGNLRKHHLIGKLDELANDELEELFHEVESIRPSRFVTPGGSSAPSLDGCNPVLANIHRATARSIHLFARIRGLECRSVLADWSNFFPVRPEQPKPIVRAAADEVAMLLNQEAILVFAGGHDLEIVSRKKVPLLAIRRVDDMDRARSCPGWSDEIKQLAAGRELQVLECGNNRFGFC